ncbi:MAG: VTT domain-containing protein [Rhodospirillales bacterium]|jgi:uncharacterized membrane protein YdjX (TVP38/TMEM64 family)|nr:VTT domain-containing protein [Rhodospirillales bacterium]
MNPRILLRGLILIAVLAAIAWAFEKTGLSTALDTTWIDKEVRGKGVLGEVLFFAVAALFLSVGLPRQVVSFLGGYAFGFLVGTLLALAATALGCVIAFGYARLLGRAMVRKRFSARIQRIDAFLHENPFSMSLLIRLLPAGSNLLTNLAAGVSSVSAAPFIAGSTLGFIPQTMIFALAGSGVSLDPTLRIGLAMALFVVAGAIGLSLYRKHRHGKVLDESVDRAIGASETDLR